jgi:signal recognition particle subunit SRP54
VFETLSDRLTQVFSALRSRGRLSDADIDATCREIRIALLEADVALPVVREFIARVRERARGEEVSAALNPAQQVIKIVHDELITILGGEERRLRFAKTPPTVIMLAGLQGSGKTTRCSSSRCWASGPGCRCTHPSPATASVTRSRSPGIRSTRRGTASTTWSSSTRPAASAWTRR